MTTINDERELPGPACAGSDWRREFIRSKLDAHFLIACRDGEVYLRADGAEWEWPAWRINFNRNTKKLESEAAFAEADSRQIRPKAQAA